MAKKQVKRIADEPETVNTLSAILDYKLFRPKYSGAIAEKARQKLAILRKVQSLNTKQKNILTPEIRRSAITLAKFDILLRNLKIVLSVLIALPFTGFGSFSYLIVANYFNSPSTNNTALILGFFGVPFFFIILWYVFIVLPINQFGSSFWFYLWEVFLLLISYIVFHNVTTTTSSQNAPSTWLIFIYASGLTLAMVIAVLLATDPLNKLLSLTIAKVKYSRYPHMIIQDRLLEILQEIEQSPRNWYSLSFKTKITKWIEEIAYCIEYYYYNRLRTGELATDKWLENNTKEIAASFRSMKKLMLSPSEKSRDILLSSVSKKLFQIASGNWDGLERTQPEIVAKPKLWLMRINYVIRVLFISVLPILAFLGIQTTSLALDKQNFEYAVIGSILWAILSLWTSIDPFYNEKINALQSLVQLFPGIKKKE